MQFCTWIWLRYWIVMLSV